MKKNTGIDLTQRPESYWADDDLLKTILRNVKGTQRRRMITDYWNAGRLEELDAELLKDELSADVRNRLGRIHPSFMGGEYLPDYNADEVEIARIQLKSTTADVVSIRARREKEEIIYRVVDEYDTEFTFKPARSRKPLTLKHVAQLIDKLEGGYDGQPFVWAVLGNDEEFSGEIDRNFVSLHSDFYPELQTWWERRLDERIAEKAKGKQS